MATTYHQAIQKLYVAYFNRPADTAGLTYWEDVVERLGGDTAPVSAAFAAEHEYRDLYAGMSNGDIVNQVYLNLFGRAAEDAGKAYWAALLDKGAITIDQVVTTIAAGALGSDAVAYANKVSAAGAFTAALDTLAEQQGYDGAAANALAKAFMAGITDDASLANALAPATFDATVARVVAAGTPFSIAAGVLALEAAQASHAAFLDAADGQADGNITLGDADIAARASASVAAVGDLTGGDYANATPAVQAALLADARAAIDQTLASAQLALDSANAGIALVDGLGAAIARKDAADAAVDAAYATVLSAMVAVADSATAFEHLHATTLTILEDGTVPGLITLGSGGQLVLATGVTEANTAGVTDLLKALVAQQGAIANGEAALAADAGATDTLDYLDMGATEKADLQQIAAAMPDVALPAGALPTLSQIAAEQAILDGRANDAANALARAGNGATQAQIDAAAATAASATAFQDLAGHYRIDAAANARADAYHVATGEFDAASARGAALDAAVAAMQAALDAAAGLKAVNAAVDAAAAAFVDHGMELPVIAAGSLAAGAGSDVFLAGPSDARIALFGQQGADALYIGTGFTLGLDPARGNDAVLEAFIVQNGADTQVMLENTSYGSNAGAPGLVTITLAGVDAAHVHLANGVITLA
jgi:hypothetical protein